MLENVYIDDCNYPVTTGEELREIKEELPGFMHEHGFPIKALACTGEKASQELSDNRFINTTNILQESEKRINSRSDTAVENTGTIEIIEWENRKAQVKGYSLLNTNPLIL